MALAFAGALFFPHAGIPIAWKCSISRALSAHPVLSCPIPCFSIPFRLPET